MDDHSRPATPEREVEEQPCPGEGAGDAFAPPDGVTKIVVAIHGIGKQFRCDTIRAVASRFGDSYAEDIPLMPLGHFNVDDGAAVRWSVLDTRSSALRKIGFAEIYWADIPRKLVEADDTLEETKAWAHTIVSRARMTYRDTVVAKIEQDNKELKQGQAPLKPKLGSQDFGHGVDAIDTIIEGIDVLEQATRLLGRFSPYKFEIGGLLRDYAGDVQTVTEFPLHRARILYRFHALLGGIVDAYRAKYPGKTPEIYLVAHSEGTVISLLALLQALSSMELADPDNRACVASGDWVEHVHGFMTIGSPIDKHIALWPKLWEFGFATRRDEAGLAISPSGSGTDGQPAPVKRLKRPIRWHNYYDHGDPVGFRLDETRAMLRRMKCEAFAFDGETDDHGFSRYLLPGKAHVDYWRDAELFRHFIDDTVQPPGTGGRKPAAPPKNRPLYGLAARAIPYLGAFLLHYAALLILLHGLQPATSAQLPHYLMLALLPALALLAMSVAVRIPQLVRHEVRWMGAAVASVALAGIAIAFLPDVLVQALDRRLAGYLDLPAGGARQLLQGAVVVLAGSSWFIMRGYLARSRSLLVGSGAVVCALLAADRQDLWTGPGLAVLGASAGFLLLWWLGIILFDLTFVWHRYIRNAVAVRTLRAWQHGTDAKPDRYWGLVVRGPDDDTDPEPKPA